MKVYFNLNNKTLKLVLIMKKNVFKTILLVIKYVVVALLGALGGSDVIDTLL